MAASDTMQAYFAQAKKFHPDQNQGSDDAKRQFQKVTEVRKKNLLTKYNLVVTRR